jgi:thiamine kinase-like enzyme
MSVWNCTNKDCKQCPLQPKLCTVFEVAKSHTISKACMELANEPNFIELIELQIKIFPVILDIKKVEKKFYNKNEDINTFIGQYFTNTTTTKKTIGEKTLVHILEQLKKLNEEVEKLNKKVTNLKIIHKSTTVS